MIDPTNITNYNLDQYQLEEELIFWVFAAGHNAKSTARGVEELMLAVEWQMKQERRRPFINLAGVLADYGRPRLLEILSKCGLGCWQRKCRTLEELTDSAMDLHTCPVEDLEAIYGIGPKTARGFILHTRPNTRYACIDTHVLKFLREKGLDVPKSTPTGRQYRRLEEAFLRFSDEAGKNPAEFDLEIWNRYAKS